MQVSVIYKIVCRANGRVCIGKAKRPHERSQQHMRSPPKCMQADFDKYGRNGFYMVTLAGCTSKKDERMMETLCIRRYVATGNQGYNKLPGDSWCSNKYRAMCRASGGTHFAEYQPDPDGN